MELRFRRFDLALRHSWAIATDLKSGGGKSVYPVVFVTLTDRDGRTGIGEASPSSQYHETHETVAAFLRRIDPDRLSFGDIEGSMAYLDALSAGDFPAKCAVNLALIDGAARVTLRHGEIKNLEMPGMTMTFRLADPKWLDGLAVGDRVRFAADKIGGNYTVTAIVKAK